MEKILKVSADTYEKIKDQIVGETFEPKEGEQYCVVRTYSAGVFVGWIDPTVTKDGRNTVRLAKRIHYWEGAASLSELSVKGVSNVKDTRIPTPVDIVYLENVIEVIPMTEDAIASIHSVPVWSSH